MNTPTSTPTPTTALAPRLVVSDGDAALDFYVAAFATEATDQMYHDGRLVNGHVAIGSTLVGVTEEDRPTDGEAVNVSPTTLGGTPVILSLEVADVDDSATRFVSSGGTVVIPVEDRPYGRRDGRFRDPFGHLWIFGQPISD